MVVNYSRSVGPVLLVCVCGCADAGMNSAQESHEAQQSRANEDMEIGSPMDHDETVGFLTTSFEQLPEAQISVSQDGTVYAQYAEPTERYGHGILGDRIEAGQLVALRAGVTYTHTLDEGFVFEDLRPRLVDVDGDGVVELVTIRTSVSKGAGIMIYRIEADELREYAWVEEIGTPSRWLNIAAIFDLDDDGTVELAWVQTPHIGGILRVARISTDALPVLSEAGLYSNHAIGESNLCLSVVAENGGEATLYVPTHDRMQIAGFQFTGDMLLRTETIEQTVDFSRSLSSQHDFHGIVQGGSDCDR